MNQESFTMIILKKNSRGLLQGGWGGCGRYSWTEGKIWGGKHNKSRRFRRAASNGPPISASCLPHLPFLQLYPRTRHFFFLHCTSYIWILNHAGLKEPNKLGCICAWSVMFDSVTPRIVAYQVGSSVHGLLQASILDWVTISSSRGSSLPRNQTRVSCTGRQILYHWATWESKPGWDVAKDRETKGKNH